eukprot:s30_g13.t1
MQSFVFLYTFGSGLTSVQAPPAQAAYPPPQAGRYDHAPLPLRLEAEPVVREGLGPSSHDLSIPSDRSDLASLPSNVMRTMPYTTYIAVGSYAIIVGSEDAAWLELCLLMNEILNAVFKFIPARIVGKQASLLRRPAGAADRFSDRTLRKPRAEFQPQTPRVGQESSRFLHLRGSRSVSAELVRSTWLSNSACYGCLTMQTTTRHMMAMVVALRESE